MPARDSLRDACWSPATGSRELWSAASTSASSGRVERLMINNIGGQVAYAVMKSLDEFAMHTMRFPVDRRRGATLVDVTAQEMRRAPAGDGGFDLGDRHDVAHHDVAHIGPCRQPSFWRSSY